MNRLLTLLALAALGLAAFGCDPAPKDDASADAKSAPPAMSTAKPESDAKTAP